MAAKRILVVGAAWVGDMMMSQVLFQLLKEQQPDCKLDVLAPPWSEPLLTRMPEVDRALSLPLGHGEFGWRKRRHLARELRHEGYDQAILLPNSLKSALIPFFANIPKRTGWRGEHRYGLLNDLRHLDKAQYPMMVQRFAALAFPAKQSLPDVLPQPRLSVNSTDVQQAMNAFSLSQSVGPVLALCPGAEFGPSKRWPDAHYAELAKQKLAQGWQVWLFGSSKDQQYTRLINQATAEQCRDLAGKTTLSQAIDLLSVAQAVVTNDSGLMHVAAALDRPMVAVYGSTSTTFTPPLSDKARTLSSNIECAPCFKRQCPLGHHRCMQELDVSLVLGALSEAEAGQN